VGRRLGELGLPPDVRVRVIADCAYGKRSLADALWSLSYHLISRLPSNAVVYELPAAPEPGSRRRGAPRRYGEKRNLRTFAQRALESPARTLALYGQAWRVHLHSQRVRSRQLGEILLVTVIRAGKDGKRSRPTYLFSTDLSLSAEETVALYAARFTVELAIRDLKNQFGLGHCQARRAGAAERHAQLALVAFCHSQLYLATEAPSGRAMPWRDAPAVASLGQLRASAGHERRARLTIEICERLRIPEEIRRSIYDELMKAA
jgi:hypothetical protein